MFWATAVTVLLLASLSHPTSAAGNFTPVIRTEDGPVRGEVLKTRSEGTPFYSFRGIPFAEPPVGNLRFQTPVPIKAWNEILDATEERNMCPQYVDNPKNGSYPGNEDCLYLNIYTPQFDESSTERYPVMVFIYGGAFTSGYKDMSSFGPDFFMDYEKKVCIVLGNYRLGAFGFSTLDDERMMGNQGIKDQYLVIKWAKRNAEHFHCDSNRITIAGQSAGSASVFVHVIAEKVKGMIQGAISLSGTGLCPWASYSQRAGTLQTFSLVTRMGHLTLSKDEAFKIMKNATVDEIMAQTRLLSYKPTVERRKWKGAYLTQCALKKTWRGRFLKIPYMMGFTNAEAVAFAGPASDILSWANDTMSGAECNKKFPLSSYSSIQSIINNGIRDSIGAVTETSITALLRFVTDIAFKGCIDLTQRLMTKEIIYKVHNPNGKNETSTECNNSTSNECSSSDDETSEASDECNNSTNTSNESTNACSNSTNTSNESSDERNKCRLYYYIFTKASQYNAHNQDGIDLPGAGHSDDIGEIFLREGLDYDTTPREVQFRKNLICLIVNFLYTGDPTPQNSTCFNSVHWENSCKTGRQLRINYSSKMVPRQIDGGVLALEKPLADASYVYTGCGR